MRIIRTALCGAWVLAAGAGCGQEDPVGVYAVVKKVRYEPDQATVATATRVRICGAFAAADAKEGGYGMPLTGYMYYGCDNGEVTASCRSHWLQMERAASHCIAYGKRRDDGSHDPVNNGQVRREPQPSFPDLFQPGPLVLDPSQGEAAMQCPEVLGIAHLVDTLPCDAPAPPPPPPPPPPTSSGGGGGGGGGSSGSLFKCSLSPFHGEPAAAQWGAGLLGILLTLGRRRRRR